MKYDLPEHEREYLRDLAKKQAGYACLPVMTAREKMWYDLNDGRTGSRPPVIIETWTFDRDFLPGDLYRCATETGKEIEKQLLRNIRNHELIDDDKVMPTDFTMGWHVTLDEFGVKIPRIARKDSQGVETAYQYVHPISNLKEDFHMLKPASLSVDREGTLAHKAFLDDLLGDILPVEIRSGGFSTMLTQRVIVLMGMEAFFLALYDAPEEVHTMMAYLRDNALSIMAWYESEGLLALNNRNQMSFGSSYNFTNTLPTKDFDGERVRLKDRWGASNSQETVGISPPLFTEFCYPYYRDVCEPFGHLYYGCCEPAHPFWDDISRLPNLKKVSISPWCDQEFMGEALRGTGIVFSRKPDPNFLSVDRVLNEDAWAAEIRKTLKASRGVQTEIIIRDVYTLHGDIGNARRAVDIARREVEKAR